MTNPEAQVEAHYGHGDMAARIFEVLREHGTDVSALTMADLTPFDQMHVRGHEATSDLATRAGFAAGMAVLDVGCGLGGPARHLSSACGCHVTGLDLTEDFVRSAAALSAKVGLADHMDFRHGSALDMPFADASFDAVWSQHVQMNIADKPRLYAEIARVLKPGGRFAAYDILAGPAGPPHYPCPWAAEPDISFLIEPDAWRAHLEDSGFAIEHWRDTTDAGLAWFAEMAERAKANPAMASLRERVVGPALRERLQNLRRSAAEGRVVLIEAIFRRS